MSFWLIVFLALILCTLSLPCQKTTALAMLCYWLRSSFLSRRWEKIWRATNSQNLWLWSWKKREKGGKLFLGEIKVAPDCLLTCNTIAPVDMMMLYHSRLLAYTCGKIGGSTREKKWKISGEHQDSRLLWRKFYQCSEIMKRSQINERLPSIHKIQKRMKSFRRIKRGRGREGKWTRISGGLSVII